MLTRKLEYLRGESQTDECAGLFKEYQVCLKVLLPHIPPRIVTENDNFREPWSLKESTL